MQPPDLHGNTPVRSTDTDALVSRHSAHVANYLADPFAAFFLPPALRRSPSQLRRPPLINLGTHARTWAVDTLVRSFLHSAPRTQVLSVGAGTDTRFWRMRKETTEQGREWTCAKWIEVDFEEATGGKARVITGKEELKSRLGGPYTLQQGGTILHAPLYSLLPIDLANFLSLAPALLDGLLDPEVPTLLLAECVFIYLEQETITTLLSWFSSTFSTAKVITYDPFGLQDSFGKVMMRNLASRNLSLPSAAFTPTLASLSDRLAAHGFPTSHSLSIHQIRQSSIPAVEIARVADLERIDEVEELNLVLQHYAVSWGSTSTSSADKGEEWKLPTR